MTGEASVKRMMEWIEGLKRQSDYGQHMKIPSGLSAGTCWELANELEQFLKALEAKGEPVAVWELFEDGWDSIADPEWMESLPVGTKLYTIQPRRTWVGLTDEEMQNFWNRDIHMELLRAIEAKLKELNNA